MNGEDVLPVMVGFARTLRAAGVAADHERTRGFLTALEKLDAGSRKDVYWAGRLTLCSRPDDIPRYDRCFAAYFDGRQPPRSPAPNVTVTRYTASPDGAEENAGEQTTAVTASTLEILRGRDVATLTPAERAEINRLLALMRTAREQRASRRLTPAKQGRLDPHRIVREAMKRGGEPARLRFRDRRRKPRRVVLLVDVSGSMAAYADTLLRLAHAVVRSAPAPPRSSRPGPGSPGSPPNSGSGTPPSPWTRSPGPSPTGAAAPGWGRSCGLSSGFPTRGARSW